MTIEDVITLFQEIEQGKAGQLIGFHLHAPIAQAMKLSWRTNQNYPATFSGFLTALKDHPIPSTQP